jgi:hypothetical protein
VNVVESLAYVHRRSSPFQLWLVFLITLKRSPSYLERSIGTKRWLGTGLLIFLFFTFTTCLMIGPPYLMNRQRFMLHSQRGRAISIILSLDVFILILILIG